MASTAAQTTQVEGAPPATQLAPPVAPTHPLEGAGESSPTSAAREPEADVNPGAAGTTTGEAGQHRSNADEGLSTPPVEMVHVKALIISGDSHVFSFEPETTVGRMKELIWSMWPSPWTSPAQPPSANFIRILHAGRVLSDDSTLASNNLPASISSAQPTVIHISVRSFSIRAEDGEFGENTQNRSTLTPADPKKPSLLHPVRSRHATNNEEDVGGCKCVIM